MNSLFKNKLFMTSMLVIILAASFYILHDYVDFTIQYSDGKPNLVITNKNKGLNCVGTVIKQTQ